MKKLLLIATGGTIASVKTENGLAPGLSGDALLDSIPEVKGFCHLECIQLFNMDSTNIRPGHWLKIGETIMANYDKYDGFVITHGTDTMAYSAAGLSYIIQNSKKPIVFTGAQVSASEVNSDARINLRDAITYACDEHSCGVKLVFSGSVISGTRARKNYTKAFAAFGSINYPEIAKVQDGHVIKYISEETNQQIEYYDFINPNVGLVKLVPSFNNKLLEFALEQYDGLIIEGFGVGGLPEYSDYFQQVKKAANSGKLIVMTTQVSNEGSNLSVYKVGNVLKKEVPILEAHDMTSEAALAKMMWILGQSSDFEKAKELFYKEINHDILIK